MFGMNLRCVVLRTMSAFIGLKGIGMVIVSALLIDDFLFKCLLECKYLWGLFWTMSCEGRGALHYACY